MLGGKFFAFSPGFAMANFAHAAFSWQFATLVRMQRLVLFENLIALIHKLLIAIWLNCSRRSRQIVFACSCEINADPLSHTSYTSLCNLPQNK